MTRGGACLLAAVLAGCGYVDDPLPPALHIPLPVTGLEARQRGAAIEVAFKLPDRTTDGVVLARLGAVELRAAASPFAGDFTKGESVPVTGTAPGPAQSSLGVGPWAGKTVYLAVRSASPRKKWSDWVETVIEAVPIVETPAAFQAESHARGVRLHWTASSRPGIQYRVYKNERETAIASGSEWIDGEARLGEEATYHVFAFVRAGKGEAWSVRTEPRVLVPVDKFPPAVPTGLTAVTGLGSIELAWDRVTDPDTVGYKVYRSAGGGAFTLRNDLHPAASFGDRDIQSGTAYRYAVTAVDERGNESDRSTPLEIPAP